MVSFVLAGKADCPFFAIAEQLADKCQNCLPDFSIRKIPIIPEHWPNWLQETCETHGWTHSECPVIWREVGPGCKGILLGGLSHFQEHCQAYYDVCVDMSSELMLKVSVENMSSIFEQDNPGSIKPQHIWICSALSPMAPFVISEVVQDPEVLPKSPLLFLHLLHLDLDQDLDKDQVWDQLSALQMETQDLASPRLHQVSVHMDLSDAFTDADLVLFLDDESPLDPRLSSGSEVTIVRWYEEYGRQLDSTAGSEVRVLLFSRHAANQKCSALLNNCPGKKKKNFITVATHLETHTRKKVAKKLHIRTEDVKDVLLWGDVCGHLHVDTQRAQVYNYNREVTAPAAVGLPLKDLHHIRSWCEGELQQVSQQQGALCCAHAVLHVLKAWDRDGAVLSAGVRGSGLGLELPEDLILTAPLQFSGGSWTLLSDLTVHKKIRSTLLQNRQKQSRVQTRASPGLIQI